MVYDSVVTKKLHLVTMKIILIIIIVSVLKCKSYLIPIASSVRYFVPIINIREINESVVYIKVNNHTHDELINSLLLGLYSDQPVVLTSGDGYSKAKKGVNNGNPNVILVAEAIKMDDFQNPQFVVIFKTYWSPIFIILTAKNEQQTCGNGTFSEKFLENADKYMNTIWHLYRSVRVIISVPYICPHHFIIFSGKRPSKLGVYSRTIKVIKAKDKRELKAAILQNTRISELTEGYPLTANIFLRFPTSIYLCDTLSYYMRVNLNYSNGFCGMDGLIMHDFIEHYKYNVSIPDNDSCNRYGFEEPEAHGATGILGCIVRQHIDISFNSRFLVHYTNIHHFYLHYISQDSLCVILKSPDIILLWHYAYNIFNLQTWTILFVLVISLGLIAWGLARLTQEMDRKESHKLHIYILNSITYTLFGFPMEKSRERLRILRGITLFCSIILLSMYQSHLSYQFNTRSRGKEIKTLHQLYESKIVLVASPSLEDILKRLINEDDTDQVNYLRNIQTESENEGLECAMEPNTATIARGYDSEIEILLNYTDKAGSPQLYVVDECFQILYLSFIARNGFLFVEESLRFMMRLLEAGLPNKYYIWTRRMLKLGDTYPKFGPESRPFGKMDMSHLRVAFGILAFGYVVSTCVFIVEKYKVHSQ